MRIETTPRTNHRRTVELLRESGAELGLSLGNAYIAPRVFKATPYGMINSHGEILPRFQRFPIRFQQTFRRTVEVNTAEIGRRVPDAPARVVGDYQRYREAGTVQSGGRSFTTPTFWQYLRMLRRHRPGLNRRDPPSASAKLVAASAESSYCRLVTAWRNGS